MMRLLLVAVAAVLCWPAAPATAAKPRPCPRDAVLESHAATLSIRSDDDGYQALTACLKTTRRRTVLAGWWDQGSIADGPAPQYWLTGRFVAINQPSCTADPFDDVPCTATMRVVDLRTRERRSTVQLTSPVFDLVLTLRGALGMIHETDLITADRGDVQHLDNTAEPSSLAYAPGAKRLYWTSAGQPRSAPLR